LLPMGPPGGYGGMAMPRATSEDWSRYYEGARQKRRVLGGDPIARYLERREKKERRFFFGSSFFLLSVLATFYVLLMR
jgi:type II secretory pathway component PulM